jgi:uncharacterized protein
MMTEQTFHEPVLKVADLVDHPGASRPVDLVLDAPDDLRIDLAEVRPPLRLHGVLESVVDGLLLRGTLSASLRLSCARCLADVEADVEVEVTELFNDPARLLADFDEVVEEGYEILDGQIDVEVLLRDALAPAVPYQPLCDPACKGLCAVCGTNRNEAECDCVDEWTDSRWAVLETLRLADTPQPDRQDASGDPGQT